MRFVFRDLDSRKDLKRLVDFLSLQDLGYPRYHEWVERAEHEIELEYKKVILAFFEGNLVGDLIYQTHKTNRAFREIKNLRVHPDLRRRDVARFMLRQAEVDSVEYIAMICDVPAREKEIIRFLRSCGYIPVSERPLYDSNNLDVIMTKQLKRI